MTNRRQKWVVFGAVIPALVLDRLIRSLMDFDYSLFSDPFDLKDLVRDLGLWFVVYALCYWALNSTIGRRQSPM